MRLTTIALFSLAIPLCAEYGFTDYHFVDPDRPWHVDGQYRWVGGADFRSQRRGDLFYADADAALYYTQFLDEDNSLSYELGYDYLKLDWAKNPRFGQTNFQYLIGTIGWVSTTLEKWKWIVNLGFSVDAERFDFDKSGVGHAMLWGRYHFANCCGVHIGVFGWYGVLNGHAWPIFGFDWKFNDHWSSTTVFPWEYSLNYAFNENWSVEAAYSYFGGPYRYPRRAHDGRNGYSDPIFMVYSNGVELLLKYKFEHLLRISLGGGWNFGGWINIRDDDNHHGRYYHFNPAPYAQGNFELTF